MIGDWLKRPGIALAMLFSAALQGCSGTDSKSPTLAAEADAMSSELRNEASSLTPEDVANIATNRKKVSCLELALAGVQSGALETAAIDAATQAVAQQAVTQQADTQIDAATPVSPAPPKPSNAQLINEEDACHCDRGSAMPGYELYERRQNLLPSTRAPEIRDDFTRYYPRGDKGAPRHLRPGEKISEDTLRKLPVVAPRLYTDACDSKCKERRTVANSKAKAEGQPEPWPNLASPSKQACAAAVMPDKSTKSN